MKVIAFNGSPRLEGNTTLLIRHVFEELEKEGIEFQTRAHVGVDIDMPAFRRKFDAVLLAGGGTDQGAGSGAAPAGGTGDQNAQRTPSDGE